MPIFKDIKVCMHMHAYAYSRISMQAAYLFKNISYFVVLTHNYVLKYYVNYDKTKSVVITKVEYVFSEYELKK